MTEVNTKDWFKEVDQRAITLSQTVSYLDRLCGRDNINDRQYLSTKSIRSQKKFDKIPQDFSNKDKKPDTNERTSFYAGVDDAKWIEERKKKFPKTSTESPDRPIETSQGDPAHSGDIMKRPEFKVRPKKEQLSIKKRKKTLFEMLMGDSDLSTSNG